MLFCFNLDNKSRFHPDWILKFYIIGTTNNLMQALWIWTLLCRSCPTKLWKAWYGLGRNRTQVLIISLLDFVAMFDLTIFYAFIIIHSTFSLMLSYHHRWCRHPLQETSLRPGDASVTTSWGKAHTDEGDDAALWVLKGLCSKSASTHGNRPVTDGKWVQLDLSLLWNLWQR